MLSGRGLQTEALAIRLDERRTVSALSHIPEHALAFFVMAHGAGAGMDHSFMRDVAEGLAARRVATLRYQFPSMEAGLKRPDHPTVAQATVRAAVNVAALLAKDLPLFAGGKSFGGRMTSQAQASAPLDHIRGLVFFGFPLHPAGRPSLERADHLAAVTVPMLFFQGTRDALAPPPRIATVVEDLGDAATLVSVKGADHTFHVPKRSGQTDTEVLDLMLDRMTAWIAAH